MTKLLIIFLSCLTLSGGAQNFQISHGPYLQEITPDGATFVFQTSAKAFSYIELKRSYIIDAGDNYYALKDGLKEAYNTFNSVRIQGLQPGEKYSYRIHSKIINSFEPYKVTFGDSITSEWYEFQTLDPNKKGASFFITSDMHGNPEKLKVLLNSCDYKSCDDFFYVGDMMNYMDNEEQAYSSFIDMSVKMFASTKSFEIVRGNHETRGKYARNYSHYFPKADGKIYGSYLLGDIMLVMLDSGEDKNDSHPVYAGLTDYNNYRSEQTIWLEKLISSKVYKKAKYRIILCHFPLIMREESKKENMWDGWQDAINKFLPILNRANVDLLVSGHTHRYLFHEIKEKNNSFPILEQGAVSATRLDINNNNPLAELKR